MRERERDGEIRDTLERGEIRRQEVSLANEVFYCF